MIKAQHGPLACVSTGVARACVLGACVMLGTAADRAFGAELVDARFVDNQHLILRWLDGEIVYQDDGQGPTAYMGHESHGEDRVIRHDPPLNTELIAQPATFKLACDDHTAQPRAVFRQAKVNGTPPVWPDPPYTLEHTVYLRLPEPVEPHQRLTVHFDEALGSDTPRVELAFDPHTNVSEAIHVDLYGYAPGQPVKAADLYAWLGDGGPRDYSAYQGQAVSLLDVNTGQVHRVGEVRFGAPRSTEDHHGRDMTGSDVWHADFSDFDRPGRYRLVIDGVGCSPPFDIAASVHRDPFALSVIGFYYMRIGEPIDARVPAPRQPRFIPGEHPAEFRVIRTTMGPRHPDWKSLGGDPWDNKDWSAYVEPGEPTNPNAVGGHSDALDWDRRAEHVQIVWDLCLPFLLANGQPADDDLGIPESGNGIPDLLDEARNEVDFWLSLRDGDGNYCFGVNNPTKEHDLAYQATSAPWMAWANAANAAILADCFRIAGHVDLSSHYRDAALEAYDRAGGKDLDYVHNLGNNVGRGRDLKALAAACLYNLTGDRRFENDLAAATAIDGPTAPLDQPGAYSQYWSTAVYLMTAKHGWRPIHHATLAADMKAAAVHEARTKLLVGPKAWPSRRSSDASQGWMQGVIANHALLIAHAASDQDPALQRDLHAAMLLEASWSRGRNPLNTVLMTGPDAQTGIGEGMRHVQDIYTSGRNDGTPGVHPGHTPYMNAEPWGEGFMADPKGWYGSKGYPAWEQWPHAMALWPARYCYANNEFTPQQTMGGKTALYAYLWALQTKR